MDRSFFDAVHDRHTPGDIKYGPVEGVESVIPLWVADMDFKVPPAVEEALAAAARRGIFGYTEPDGEYDALVTGWYRQRMDWDIRPEWLLKAPTVLSVIAVAIRALTEPGDAVLIYQPVYHPFAGIIKANHRRLAVSELRLEDGRYEMDLEEMEELIRREGVKALLFCSPHNPVGRVWTRAELEAVGRLCCENDVWIISDEIHSDFVYPGHRHIPIASLSEELARRTVTCTAPTKTFNLAGLQAANAVIPDPALRRRVAEECRAAGHGGLNCMAIAATKAAYRDGAPWLDALLRYLQDNRRLLEALCRESGGKLRLIEPEGTYLMWMDAREMARSGRSPADLFLKETGVRLHDGAIFGAGGAGFLRMNIACPAATLTEALARMKKVL